MMAFQPPSQPRFQPVFPTLPTRAKHGFQPASNPVPSNPPYTPQRVYTRAWECARTRKRVPINRKARRRMTRIASKPLFSEMRDAMTGCGWIVGVRYFYEPGETIGTVHEHYGFETEQEAIELVRSINGVTQ